MLKTYTEGSSLYGEFMKDIVAFGEDTEEMLLNQSTRSFRQLSEQYNKTKFEAVFGCTST